jgi:DNA modification methylase
MIVGKESRRNDSTGITHTHHFHIKSCIAGLSKFWSDAEDVADGRISSALKLAASAANPNISKLRRFRTGKKGGGPLAGTLYVASLITPQNPIESIRRNIEFVRKAFSYANINNNSTASQIASAELNLLEPNTIDYIFTDPPFGANIDYSELNFLWESWLKVITNNSSEAIESKTQGKTLFDYQEIMSACFREYFRILKPNHWMTVEFSNTGAAVWNSIQTAIQRAGFIIANVSALDKKQSSFKAVRTPTAVKQDLVISCYKPSIEFDNRFAVQSGEINVWDFVNEHLDHLPISIVKDKTTTAIIERNPKILYDRLISFYLMRNLPVPIDASDFQLKLKQKYREIDGMIFTPDQLAQYEEQKRKLGISDQINFVFDAIYSESEAIAWLNEKLEKAPKKRQDIYTDFRKANTATRKGEKELELSVLLEENFIQESDSTWRVPDPNEAKDREILRNKALLKEFATYLGNLALPKPKKLKDVRLEALRAGYKDLWEKKDFPTIVKLSDYIPQNLLMEDEMLLTYYDIARDRM